MDRLGMSGSRIRLKYVKLAMIHYCPDHKETYVVVYLHVRRELSFGKVIAIQRYLQ